MTEDDIPTMSEKHLQELRERNMNTNFYHPGVNSKRYDYEHSDITSKWIFIEHSDGATYQEISKVSFKRGGGLYVERRYTEITNPKWYHRPLYWIIGVLK